MDKQTFESLKKVADRLNKLERSEKEFLLKDWPKLMKDLTDFEVKGDDLLLNGKKIYEFYVPKDGKDGIDGKDGERGPAGKDGIDGKAGRDGRDGSDGKDGKDGREISIFVVDNKICWSYEGSDVYYDLVDLDKLKGKDGKDGKNGKSGPAGKGVAKGGTANQILMKTSDKDYDTEWVGTEGLISDEVVKKAVEGIVGEQFEEVKETAERAEVIAKGRATGYVFDTTEDLDLWLANTENTSKLVLGDNLYIRAVGVPDYWWDGSSKQQLETQKVDLTEYVKNTDYATSAKAGIIKASSNQGFYISPTSGDLSIVQATQTDIDNRNNKCRPITSNNLVYAVESVVGGHITLTQAEYDALETKDENTFYYIVEEG